jgi:hypothetical protein
MAERWAPTAALKTNSLALSLAAAAAIISVPASAASRKRDIINKSGNTVTCSYASNSGTDSREEDILGRGTLDGSKEIEINFSDGTGACKFDFKAVFSDGSSRVREGIDARASSTNADR